MGRARQECQVNRQLGFMLRGAGRNTRTRACLCRPWIKSLGQRGWAWKKPGWRGELFSFTTPWPFTSTCLLQAQESSWAFLCQFSMVNMDPSQADLPGRWRLAVCPLDAGVEWAGCCPGRGPVLCEGWEKMVKMVGS